MAISTSSTTKRRMINQLPVVNQTDTLKNFFAATVDHLFQPGESEAISGYVGQKPVYYDPTQDFYLAESTPARAAYQLEPAMISSNTGGVITDSLCYDDLINYLRSQGALINDHSRLFEGDYYSWAPPVDLDMLNNYLQYVWMGSLTDAEQQTTVIKLQAPRATYSYDGTNTFILPPAIPTISPADENPVVLVNGVPVSADFDNTGTATITSANNGDVVEVIRYGDLTTVINGNPTFDYTKFMLWTPTVPDYINHNIAVPATYSIGDLVYAPDSYGNFASYVCVLGYTATNTFTDNIGNWNLAPNAQFLTTGSRVRLIDGLGTTATTGRLFFVNGVGTSIQLSSDHTTDDGGSTPHYIVIDRRSQEQSPWSLRNLWVHKSSLDWTGLDFSSRKASRPIIQFLPDIELYNYGTRRLSDVQGVLSSELATVQDNWDVYPWDDNVWDRGKVELSRVNGKFFGRLNKTATTYLGSVVVDNNYVLQPNDRLFVHQSVTLEPELNNYVYNVISNPDVPLPSGASADVIELVLSEQPERGDIFRIAPVGGVSVFSDPVEYWFNGVEWLVASSGAGIPLFRLYDSEQNALDDLNTYPASTFDGSALFSYQIGNGVVDPVLGFPIVNNSFGQPTFEINPIVERVTYAGGAIIGFYYHHFVDLNGPGTFSNNWFAVATPSTQALVDGVYEIPLNLQGNPGNEEISYISRNQWFDHFSAIMTSQVGFTGAAYSVNNWRDTAKVLGDGDKILQHRAPLLKTMLISNNANYDLPQSLRYADQEYTRYRNKFIQALIDLRNRGVLLDTDVPTLWVSTALNNLRLNKTSDFAFSGSRMAGDQYFIPPTPSSMGLALVAQPGLIYDTTYNVPVLMIRGHDGSLIPAFNDFRDPILVALEQQIYNNIPAKFKTEIRPLFDFALYVKSFFNEQVISSDATANAITNTLGFTRSEIDTMLSPFFQRWTQSNRLDYRANNSYDPGNPFTWNYNGTLDATGNLVPGFWRGIYRYYFDTDRPHLAPWEMLGFIDQPTWWFSEYGAAPYTRGNTKLWDDIRDGNIAGGVRLGIDPRYVRPSLYDYLPVDDEGLLLDPIACNIIPQAPTFQLASAPWSAGDYAPVESLWRTSPSFRYAQAQVSFLIKPARFVEQGWDTINQIQDSTGQWIYAPTGNRPMDSELTVHGETNADGSKVIVVGVQQWISDYMVSRGQDPTNFGDAIRGLQVRLAHKMAGFTSTTLISAIADNFGLVPNEDLTINLYHSPSIREEVYSGVLIEWTGGGYRVLGYDTRNPFFNIVPGFSTGPRGVISIATVKEPSVRSWKPNVYYPTGTNVLYQNTVYAAKKGHTSGQTFEITFWTATGGLPPQAPRVSTYLTADLTVTETVPYGTVFTTFQQVADFILGYGRYLTRQGWTFDGVDPTTQTPLDWNLAVKEFLGWAQVNWQPGNFITLSPGAQGVTFATDQGMVLDVLSPVNGTYGMLDRAGLPIDRRNVVINRLEGAAKLFSKNDDVFCARVSVGEIEHILIFDNTTIFNDLIYAPLFNLRQPRLRLLGRRSTDWNGRLDAPGYMLIDNQIKSNFDKSATDLLTMFDIEKADNPVLTDHARHLIGYDARDYLSTLVLSEVEQFEFYQGLIHQKGAPGAFDKLLRSDFIEQSRSLMFFEEWAFKINEFGAVNTRDRLSFLFGSSSILRDPQYVEFRQIVNSVSVPDEFTPDPKWIELIDSATDGLDSKWIERPQNTMSIFPKRESVARQPGDLPVSGYVRLPEVTYTVFNASDVPSIYNAANATMNAGEVVWVHHNDLATSVANAQASSWYILGVATAPGHWDATSQTRTDASTLGYTAIDNGNLVFISKPGDAPFIADDAQFVPTPGQTYTVTFTMRKTQRESAGSVKSYVRPAFDAFDSSGNTAGALGVKAGFGYDPSTDLIDTTAWVIGQYYEVTATWQAPSSPVYSSARGRLRVNRSYPLDDIADPYSDAIFEVEGVAVSIATPLDWDALRIYNMSADAAINYVSNVVTHTEDSTMANNIVRVFTQNPHGLTGADRGLFYVIDGDSQSTTNVQGCYQIADVGGANYFDVSFTGDKGHDFVAAGEVGPEVRILRSVHFVNQTVFNSSKNRIGSRDGDLAYVDGNQWMVYQRSSLTENSTDWQGTPITNTVEYWNAVRVQPARMDATAIFSSLIYDLKTSITPTDLQPEPLQLDHLTVTAPLVGIIPGKAAKEIDYILDYDPAHYNLLADQPQLGGFIDFTESTTADLGVWGPDQVGRVWWDVSTVRFLETETDDVSFGVTAPDRYNNEVHYRITNWGKIAPATSLDVYEWTRSIMDPYAYANAVSNDTTGTFTGEVYSGTFNYVVSEEYVGSVPTTFYYFWVKNVTVIPNVSFRTMAVADVAQFITNPMIEDAPWIAPIMPNGVLVGGATPFVDDTFNTDTDLTNTVVTSGTVLQIEISNNHDGVIHDEWFLMRPQDELSQPPNWLWEKLRDSLVGFDNNKVQSPVATSIPNAAVPVNRLPVWYTQPGPSGTPINQS